MPLFDRAQKALYANGGFAAPEAWHAHRALLSTPSKRDLYDPRVASRIAAGEACRGADFIQLARDREAIVGEAAELLRGFDAYIAPTTATTAPTIADAGASDEAYVKLNLLLLRNTGLVNALDGCAASLPCHADGAAPVGFMVAGAQGADAHVLAVAQSIEAVLQDDGDGGEAGGGAKKPRLA